ncbi:MAG: response regulator [Ignavibacteriales bacterium]|nr:MAG: response regulator [Ignavibacteriales bacterium]
MDNKTHPRTLDNELKEMEILQDIPTILVIDDDEKILEAFSMLMESENCTMISATNVNEALAKIEGKNIDLIITDFMLKTKSSVELFSLIKKTHPNVPIVVMTGYPELISEKDVKMFGGHFFLTKPLELGKLRKVIRNYVNPLKIGS